MLDVKAMYWKEMKDLFAQGSKQMALRLFLVSALGIWISWQIGISWLQLSPLGILFLSVYPIVLVFTLVADVFAGERERHTLESLLATRLSDWSIAAGKGAALVTLSWGMTVVSTITSFVAVNIEAGAGHVWSFYPLDRLLIVVLLSLVVSVLAITIGILISLHASTVRQAQQTLLYCLMGLSASGALVTKLLVPEILDMPFVQPLFGLGIIPTLLLIIASIAIIDVALFALVLLRFQRSRLILS